MKRFTFTCVFAVLTGSVEVQAQCEVDETQEFVALSLMGEQMGSAIAIDGDIAVVGSTKRLHPTGCGELYCTPPRGAAYIFGRGANNQWTQQALIFPAVVSAGYEGFGTSVAVAGDTVIVGAPRFDQFGVNSGAVYVFERNLGGPNTWGEAAVLFAGEPGSNQWFGFDAALDGDTLIVGAYLSHNGTIPYAGAVYIFRRDHGGPGNWGQVARLTASDPTWGRMFGYSLALDGDTAIVGAPDGWFGAGSAYVFQRDQGGPDKWGQIANFTAADAGPEDFFGGAVALSGDTVLVSMIGEDSPAGFSTGKAYVFARDHGGPNHWGQVRAIFPPQPEQGAEFGAAVALEGDVAIIGAPFQNFSGVANAGRAYGFERNHGGADNWGLRAEFEPNDLDEGDLFSTAIAIDDVTGDTLLITSPNDGNSDPHYGPGPGSAYAFALSEICPCMSINGDEMVDVNDLLMVIGSWGAIGPNPADINHDQVVNVNDLLAVVAAWGPCS